MNPLLSIEISYRAIKSNKIKSFLTTLGITIGVAAVISLVSITGRAKDMIEGQLASLGANSLVVNSGKRTKSGKTVKENLFGDQNPLGKSVRIDNYTYRVIGVMSPIGPTPSGKDQDDIVLLPYTSVQKRIVGSKSLNRITVFVDPTYDLAYAQGEIEKTLRRQHGIKDEMDDDFFVRTQQAQLNPIEALRYE